MKQTAIAVMLLMVACTANAETEASQWRVGGSLSYSEYERDDGEVDDSGIGFKVHGQYRLNSWAGIEGAYYISPDFKGNTTQTSGGETETSYKGITVDGIVYLPAPIEEMDIFLKGGYFNFDSELEGDSGIVGSGSEDGPKLGLGAGILTDNDIGIRVDFDWYDTSGAELWTIGIGAEYRF